VEDPPKVTVIIPGSPSKDYHYPLITLPMDILILVGFFVLLALVAFLLWKNGQQVSPATHRKLEQEKQQAILDLTKIYGDKSIAHQPNIRSAEGEDKDF